MCIEDRHKQQDVLREYFSKHGFRVLVLSDLQRGLTRLKSSPPDCMVIMGESLGEDAVKGYGDALDIRGSASVGLVLVLAEQQSGWKERLAEVAIFPGSRAAGDAPRTAKGDQADAGNDELRHTPTSKTTTKATEAGPVVSGAGIVMWTIHLPSARLMR